MKPVYSFTLALSIIIGSSTAAFTHSVSILAHWDGGEVHTDSYYADGKPIEEAHVAAQDMEGRVVFEGVTDRTGAFDFPDPRLGDLRIVMTAPSGHRSETVLRGGSDEDPGGDPGKVAEKVLERRLRSIQDSLQALQRKLDRPRLSEILGGIGWIIGLAGAYLWGVSRGIGRGDPPSL